MDNGKGNDDNSGCGTIGRNWGDEKRQYEFAAGGKNFRGGTVDGKDENDTPYSVAVK